MFRTKAFLSKVILFTLLLCAASFNAAAIWPVAYVDVDNTSGTENGYTWGEAFTSIQAAIDAASSPTEIWVAEGTYTSIESQVVYLPEGQQIYGGFAGTETLRTERDPVAHPTIIDGEDTRRCVNVTPGVDGVVLDGFTLKRGSDVEGGAGLAITYSSIQIANCIFTENKVSGNYSIGAALYIYNPSALTTVTDCLFEKNTGTAIFDGLGGAVHVMNGPVQITDCTFRDNELFGAPWKRGGALYLGGSGQFTISGCTFSGNKANAGGAVYTFNESFTFSHCDFLNNTAKSENFGSCCGGAVYTDQATTGKYEDCLFRGNRCEAVGYGGALYTTLAAASIIRCTFVDNAVASAAGSSSMGGHICTTGNSISHLMTVSASLFANGNAEFGGAIACNNVLLKAANNLFAGNHASVAGGGVHVSCNFAPDIEYVNLNNCSFYDCYSEYADGTYGGSVRVEFGQTSITNCILWPGSHVVPQVYSNTPTDLTVSFSDIHGGYEGTGNINADPRYFSPEGYDFSLLPDSPCIDVADAATASASAYPGNVRPFGVAPDMGAYEWDGSIPAPNVGWATATIEPAEAIAAGARWGLDPLFQGYESDFVARWYQGSAGLYFKNIFGWDTPTSVPVSITENTSNLGTGTYVRQYGDLKVNVLPVELEADAEFSVDGGTTWLPAANSHNLGVGLFDIEMSSIPGYNAPTGLSVITEKDTLTSVTATYVLQIHAISITLDQPGAQWQLDGDGVWHDSGEVVATTPGVHTITFSNVDGFGSIEPQEITVPEEATSNTTASYNYPPVFYVDLNANGADDGTSWANAFNTPQLAMTAASNAGGGEVWIAGGTYTTATPGSDVIISSGDIRVLGGFVGTETNFSQRDLNNPATILDGEGAVRTVLVQYGHFTGDGLTLINGFASNDDGGALFANYAAVTLRDCMVQNCIAGYGGGGVGIFNSSSARISNCRFIDNSAMQNAGGLYISATPCVIDNCEFTGNETDNTYGGLSVVSTSFRLSNSTFTGNTGPIGGGLGLDSISGPSSISNCQFDSNDSRIAGAIYASSGNAQNPMTFSECSFRGNTSTEQSGALFFSNTDAEMERCTFENNQSEGYGAVLYQYQGQIRMSDCLIKGNRGRVSGFAFVENYDEDLIPLKLMNCTIVGNSWDDPYGYNIFLSTNSAPLVAVNCIFRNVSGREFSAASVATVTYSDVWGGFPGEGNIDAYPMFSNSGANDYTLVAGSPCIDAGTSTGASATDIRGVTRPQGAGVDMGAFEGSSDSGFVKVLISPAEALTDGAQWSLDDGTDWFNSNDKVPTGVGDHTVHFKPITFWSEPVAVAVTIVKDQTALVEETYTTNFGTLTVTLEPSDAANAGAYWSEDGWSTWRLSGDSVRLSPGSYTVEFYEVSGWKTPAPVTVDIVPGANISETGQYVPYVYAVKVDLMPAGAIAGGAQWQLDYDGVWRDSGATVETYPGNHAVSFKEVPDYRTPDDNYDVMIMPDATAAVVVEGHYLQRIYVDRDNAGAQTQDGASWQTAFESLQQAADLANTLGGGEIWVGEGVYTGVGDAVVSFDVPVNMIGGFIGLGEGGLEETYDPGTFQLHPVIIDGEMARRCVYASDEIYLGGVTLVNGLSPTAFGGGLYAVGSKATLVNCVVRGCHGAIGAGACFDGVNSVSVSDSLFELNEGNAYGSALATNECSFVHMYDSAFQQNTMGAGGNGAVAIVNSISKEGFANYKVPMINVVLNISSCDFTGNQAGDGSKSAGLFIEGASGPDGDQGEVSYCRFRSNRIAGNGAGGGLFAEDSDLWIFHCSYEDNNAGPFGSGGALCSLFSDTRVDRCDFLRNTAPDGDGGAIYCVAVPLSIENSVFLANTASLGGAIAQGKMKGARTEVVNCSMYDNEAALYGNSLCAPQVGFEVTNSILWGTEGNQVFGPLDAISFSDIQGPTANSGDLGTVLSNTGNLNVDPMFADTEEGDLTLAAGSPCIDAGTNVGAPGADKDDLPRPQGATVDMGAFESRYASLTVTLTPDDVVSLGALWSLDNGITWYASQEVVTGLVGGENTYQIFFSDVAGWNSPISQYIVLQTGNNSFDFEYTPTNEGEPTEGQPTEGQNLEGQPVEGQPTEGEPLEGQLEGEPSEGQLEGEQPLEGEQYEPVAQFTAEPVSGVAPLVVSFADLSDGGGSPIIQWLWTFGDAVTSSDQNPVHTYTTPGLYEVSLVIYTENGHSSSMVKNGFVRVTAEPEGELLEGESTEGETGGPTASFDADPTMGIAPLTVTFTNLSTAGASPITNWAWNFGDGGSSNAQSPVHVYAEPGAYTVSLIAISSSGNDSEVKTDFVVVMPASEGQPLEGETLEGQTEGQPAEGQSLEGQAEGEPVEGQINAGPIANFTGNPRTGLAPLTVEFMDLSDPGDAAITEWGWSFGDGTISTEQNPTHVYSHGGVYSVALVVQTIYGINSSVKTDFIVVEGTNEGEEPVEGESLNPVADFDAFPIYGDAPLSVEFTDQSTSQSGPLRAWIWNFGDNVTGLEQNPVHIYTAPGAYTVTLVVANDYGTDMAVKNAYITVMGEAEGQAPVEGQTPTEGQTPVEGQKPAEGQKPTEGQKPVDEGEDTSGTGSDGEAPSTNNGAVSCFGN